MNTVLYMSNFKAILESFYSDFWGLNGDIFTNSIEDISIYAALLLAAFDLLFDPINTYIIIFLINKINMLAHYFSNTWKIKQMFRI